MTRTQSETDADMQRAQIGALIERLRPYDTLDPPQEYWIEDPAGGMEYGPDGDCSGGWCEEHAKDIHMRLNLYTPGDGEYLLQCSDTCGENDVIPRCGTCGITLAGWPTDYCRSEEQCFFEDDPDWEPSPENLHVIGMVLWNLQWETDCEIVDAWMAIGEAALAKIGAALQAMEVPRG
jgi:hypothetical protein